MRLNLLLIFFLPIFCIAQETEKEYSMAISEYIKAAREKEKIPFDTLFIGKHEEFPYITLPAKLENTVIIIMPFEEIEKKYFNCKSLRYVNIVSTYTKIGVEFLLIGFRTEKIPEKMNWWPLHNCHINYKYGKSKNDFMLDKIIFEYSYENMFTTMKTE